MAFRHIPLCNPAPRGGCNEHGGHCPSPGKIPLQSDWAARGTPDRPDGNYGVLTGPASDLLVVDIDTPEAAETVRSWGLPETYTVRSGRADGVGLHLYFRWPAGVVRVPNRLDGVEIKGPGRQVVGPGSQHASGNEYRVDRDLPLATLPPAFVARVAEAVTQRERVDRTEEATPEANELLEAWVERFGGGEEQRDGNYVVCCPAHNDHDPSLVVTASGNNVLLNCRAGCTANDIVAAVDMTLADLFAAPETHIIPERGVVSSSTDWLAELDDEQLQALDVSLREALLEEYTYSVSEILSRRPPAFLIPGFLQEEATAQIVGPFAGGKSLLTLHWCAQLVRKGHRVLYCAAEGLAGFNGRIRALMAEQGIEAEALDGIAFYKPDVDLTKDASADQLARFCELTGPWAVIVIDTLARAIAGQDENAAGVMSEAIKRAERSKTGKTTILLVHHAGWTGERGRGSTAIPSAQDNIVHCFPASDDLDGKEGRPLVMRVVSEKMKDGRKSVPVYFSAREHVLGTHPGDGGPWTSVALVEVPAPPTAAEQGAGDLLALFRVHDTLTRMRVEELLGVSKTTAVKLIAEAVKSGTVLSEGSGPSTRYRAA